MLVVVAVRYIPHPLLALVVAVVVETVTQLIQQQGLQTQAAAAAEGVAIRLEVVPQAAQA
jgi:hypothetical protein